MRVPNAEGTRHAPTSRVASPLAPPDRKEAHKSLVQAARKTCDSRVLEARLPAAEQAVLRGGGASTDLQIENVAGGTADGPSGRCPQR